MITALHLNLQNALTKRHELTDVIKSKTKASHSPENKGSKIHVHRLNHSKPQVNASEKIRDPCNADLDGKFVVSCLQHNVFASFMSEALTAAAHTQS
jgi:hypothetical protein